MAEVRLLMISRDDLLKVATGQDGDHLFRALGRLTRSGYQLLATAPQPEEWTKKHGGPDDALLGPESLRKRLADAGGTLDGVYYVPRSLFTQKRNRETALRDIMKRYALKPAQCFMYSSSRSFVIAAQSLGISATYLGEERELLAELRALIRNLPDQAGRA
ncbi:MAG: hypothetical protein PVJ17_15475 [Lysobacterales bacterium]|jgi:hypothetical protein